MADDRLPLAELMAKTGDVDSLRSIAESVLQIIMEADVDASSAPAGMRGPASEARGAKVAATAAWTLGGARSTRRSPSCS